MKKIWVVVNFIDDEVIGIYDSELKAQSALVDYIDDMLDSYPHLLELYSRDEWHGDAFKNQIVGIEYMEMLVQ